MELLKLSYSEQEVLKPLLELQTEQIGLQLGTARILKGMKLPEQGESCFSMHEISIVISGRLQIESEQTNEKHVMEQGNIVSITPNQYSRTTALEDTHVLYLFFGRQEQFNTDSSRTGDYPK
ncbi:MAG: hypothetical protein GKR93_19295 [Gammaproteobacteria bacterium]|nr:hypothetical protein [Gammaproteobacteria bacterium]